MAKALIVATTNNVHVATARAFSERPVLHILALSSLVCHGHVGLSAAVPVLQTLGHTVTQMPTVMLSNHPGWSHVAGQPVSHDLILDVLDALEANGWMTGLDAVLTGYLPTARHVEVVAHRVARLGASGVRVVVDPVLGDDPKGLYLPLEVAQAIRDHLLPLADALTPNRFELEWLSGCAVQTPADLATACALVKTPAEVIVTSAPLRDGHACVYQAHTGLGWSAPRREGVPNGVGDVFSALIAAGCDMGQAVAYLDALIGQSLHADHLRIAEAADSWTRATARGHDFPEST